MRRTIRINTYKPNEENKKAFDVVATRDEKISLNISHAILNALKNMPDGGKVEIEEVIDKNKKVFSLQERRAKYENAKEVIKQACDIKPVKETVNTITTDKLEISIRFDSFEEYRRRTMINNFGRILTPSEAKELMKPINSGNKRSSSEKLQ